MKVNTRLEKLENAKFLTGNKNQTRPFMEFLFHIILLMLPLFAQYNYYFYAQCTQKVDVLHLCYESKQFLIHSTCLADPKPLNAKMVC